ncbi:hypothetical protein SCRM01_284 [Synechococcus phage S-CRM01]|uniref:hypothetical protein n=1 Tax=Synechococcus phage S-CRM01 TaxID=1026955 RepID=UPI000209E318|nr:hypothetical protein SCRM01_284 [Synechococcus phage S-CRM01]AEC53230.1 hypothetical protein SCRM01_284 [Synechococcus phage S-CRM01]
MKQPFITMSSDGGSIGRIGWHNFNRYNNGFGYVWWARSWPWVLVTESIIIKAQPRELNTHYTINIPQEKND